MALLHLLKSPVDKEVLAAPIPAITLEKPELFQRYAERIAVDSEFFVTGRCLGRPMVCTVRAGHTKASARVFDLVPAKNSHSLRGLTVRRHINWELPRVLTLLPGNCHGKYIAQLRTVPRQ